MFGLRKGVIRRAHRIAWELVYGPIPSGLKCLHRCDNPSCVRPDHLFLGTVTDNAEDMIVKGRARYIPHLGAENGNARLTQSIADDIRQRFAAERQTALAKECGVNQTQISRIVAQAGNY
jgi:hypothetical protein